jgi:hypothetical protein
MPILPLHTPTPLQADVRELERAKYITFIPREENQAIRVLPTANVPLND